MVVGPVEVTNEGSGADTAEVGVCWGGAVAVMVGVWGGCVEVMVYGIERWMVVVTVGP